MSRIIFGSANHWTSPYQVGSHAWARLFTKHDWQVAYVSDPVTPWHFFSPKNRERTCERFALWKSMGKFFENGKLRAWVPYSLIAPHRTTPFRGSWALEKWDFFSMPSVINQMNRWGFESPDILWLDSVRHAEWGRRLNPKFTVLRIADWSGGFKNIPPSVLEMERKLIAEVDLVITSAKTLEDRVKPFRNGKPLVTIRNGVDVSFWNVPCDEPLEYAHIPFPRAIYVGALDEWFDMPLLIAVAKALRNVSFVLIGQERTSFDKENIPSNIYLLGSRSREKVPAYVRHAQVGIIPFKRTELIEYVCPLKLFEYAACGLPIVSTRWTELEQMNSPARLVTGPEEWIYHLGTALKESGKDKLPMKTSIDYAVTNDWQHRWVEWKIIYKRMIPKN